MKGAARNTYGVLSSPVLTLLQNTPVFSDVIFRSRRHGRPAASRESAIRNSDP